MANKAFNSIDGFSVGQPANVVIDGNSDASLSNANIVGNATFSGNANVTGNINITDIANFHIPGGLAGQGIATDGIGNLSWYTFSGGGGGGSPAAPANAVQFNDAGNFGGTTGFTYNNTTSTLSVFAANLAGNLRAGNANLGNLASANYVNVSANVLTSNLRVLADLNAITANFYGDVNVQANLSANYFVGNGSYLTSVTAARVANGTSNVDILPVNGAISMGSNGVPNVFFATATGVTVTPSFTLSTANTAYNKTIISGTGDPYLVLSDVDNLTIGMVLSGSPFNTTPRAIITSIDIGTSSVTISKPPTAGILTTVTFTSYPAGNLNVNTIAGNLGLRIRPGTYIDNIAVAGGTVANAAVHAIAIPTVGASNNNVTFANAATFYIQGAPITIGPANITNAYSLLVHSGTSRFDSDIQISGNVNSESQLNALNADISGYANVTSLAVSLFSDLGNVSNITISGGSPGYFLQTDGSGILDWGPSPNDNPSPAGANQTVQYNNEGNFGAIGAFTFDSVTEFLTVPSLIVSNGNITANSLSIYGSTQNASFSIGTSNLIISNNGPIRFSSGGTSNVVSISTSNVNVNSTLSTTGSLIYQGQTELVNASSLIAGQLYQIQTQGDTNWAAVAGTNNIAVTNLLIGVSYIITTVGDTDWLSVGATTLAVVEGEISDVLDGQAIGEINDGSGVAYFTGGISDGLGGPGQILDVSAVTGGVVTSGMFVSGFGVDPITEIFSQLTGIPGGIGTYFVGTPQLVAASTSMSGAISGTNLYITNIIIPGSGLLPGTRIVGPGVTPNTTILAQIDGPSGGIGNYTVDINQLVFSTTLDAISPGDVLNVYSVTSGALEIGSIISGTSVVPGTTIISFYTGTGGIGTYQVDITQAVPSTTISILPNVGTTFIANNVGSGTGIADQYYVTGDSFIATEAGTGTGVAILNGKQDRGSILSYWESNLGFPANAFMGWNQANLEFIVANQVTVDNGIITEYTEGNLRANWFLGNVFGTIYGPIGGPGLNTQIIYQDGQFMAGAAGFTYDNITNSVYISNVLAVDGDILANSNVNINGYLNVNQDSNVGGNLNVIGNINGLGNIYTQFDASIGGNANIGNNMLILGNLITPGNINANNISGTGNIAVAGNISGQDITVSGNITALANISSLASSITTDLTIGGNLIMTTGGITAPFGNMLANGFSSDGNDFIVSSIKSMTIDSANLRITSDKTEFSGGYINVSSYLHVSGYIESGGVIYANSGFTARNQSPITTTGNINGGNLLISANGYIPNLTATFSNLSNNQPNITHLGTLTNLVVTGNITTSGDINLLNGNVIGLVDGALFGPTYYIGNAAYLSGIVFTGSTGGRIENGGSNISIFGPSTNIEMAVNLVNVVSISSSVMSLTGFPGTMDLIISGNLTAPSFANGTSNIIIRNNGNITLSSNGIANILTIDSLGNVTANGNASINKNLLVKGNTNLQGNITEIYGEIYANANANIIGNLLIGTFNPFGFAPSYPGKPLIKANANIAGETTIGGNLTVGWSQDLTSANTGLSNITVFGNVRGLQDGDPRGTTYYFGNAAFLEGIPPSPAGSYISNGSSNVSIYSPGANINMSVNTVNVVTVSTVIDPGNVANIAVGLTLQAQRDAGPGGLPTAYLGPANLNLLSNSSINVFDYGNIELDQGYIVGPHANINTLYANVGNIPSFKSSGITIEDTGLFGSGELVVQGNASIQRSLNVSVNANVGYLWVSHTANITGTTDMSGNLRMFGPANINFQDGGVNANNLAAANNLTIHGNAIFDNYITVNATLATLGVAGIRGNLGRGNTYVNTPNLSGNMYVYMGNIANLADYGTQAIVLTAPSLPVVTTTASEALYAGNVFTVLDSTVFSIGDPIKFTGSVFGNVDSGTRYYVETKPNATSLTISKTLSSGVPGAPLSVALIATAVSSSDITDAFTFTGTVELNSGIMFSGVVFGGVSLNTVYYITDITLSTIRISETYGGATVPLTVGSGSMTITNAIAVDVALSTLDPAGDFFTVTDSDGYAINDAVQFTGVVFGGVTLGTTYYIQSIPSPVTVVLSTTPNGPALPLLVDSGSMTMTRVGYGGLMTVKTSNALDTTMTLVGKLDVLRNTIFSSEVDILGNLTVGNNVTIDGALNVDTINLTGSLNVPGNITADGNITGGNLISLGDIDATGNLSGVNETLTGNLSILGNIEGTSGSFANLGNAIQGNYFVGNGFYLTGVVASGPPYSRLENGSSNIEVLFADGNATITVGGIANVLNVTTVGANIKGIANITGNLIVGGNANIRVNANIGGSLSVSGNANVIGNANVSENLVVVGSLKSANANLGYQANAEFFVGNGFYLTGIQALTGTSMVNGSSNVVTRYSGNTTMSVGGIPNIFLAANTGVFVTGNINATANANISGNLNLTNSANIGGNTNITGNLKVGNITNVFSIINGTSNLRIAGSGAVSVSTGGVANVATFSTVATTLTGNLAVLQDAAITGNLSANNISVVHDFALGGNLQAVNLTILGVSSFGGAVSIPVGPLTVGGDTVLTGNLTVSNNQFTLGTFTAGSWINAAGAVNAQSLISRTTITSTGNLIVGGNANIANKLTVTGNANVGNLGTVGNITAGFFVGNGSQLTGVTASGGTATELANGISNIIIPIINSNILMSANGTTNVLIIANTGAYVSTLTVTGNSNLNGISNVKIAGGASGQVIQTDGLGNLSFIAISTSSISNGTSNIDIPDVNGNVNISSNGHANILVVTGTGIQITGNSNIVGVSNLGPVSNVKITGGSGGQVVQTDGLGNLSFITISTSSLANGTTNLDIPVINGNINLTSNGNTTLVATGTGANVVGTLGVTGNITSGNANLGNLILANYVNVTANITAGNANLGNLILANYVNVTANITAGNANLGNLALANYVTVSSNITAGNANLGNLALANYVNVTSNITAGNANLGNLVTANYGNFANTLTVTGNANVGNLDTIGNITAGFFIGNGSQLTGITATSGTANILANGTSNVNIPTVNGNITIGSDGIGNVVVITSTGMNVSGTANITGNITSGNANLGNLILANYVNVTANITAGNANLGNLALANYVTVTANITAGNANLGNLILANYGNFANNLTVIGNANVGNLGTVGNITAGFFIGNGSELTGITATSGTANILANGTSNVNIPTINGNITIGSAGVSNVVVISSTGMNVSGTANITGNITSANANLGNLALANYVNVTSNITAGNANLGNLVTANYGNFANNLTVIGNANVGNLGTIGNITAGFFIGNGSELTGITATSGTANILANGTSNVNIPTINGNITIGSAGIGNVVVITSTGMNVAGTANVTGNITSANANLGNLVTANYVNVSSNITAGNANLGNLVTANYGNFANTLTVIGNANVGNLGTVGNITAGFFIGNGSELTGITATSGTANILANGTSNVNIPTINGNITIGSAGVSNVVVITGTGMNVSGTANITGNITSANANLGNLALANYVNVTANITTGNANLGNLVTANYGNFAHNLTIIGNANVGNLGTGGLIVATGNVSGGNLTTSGNVVATDNGTFGNVLTNNIIGTTLTLNSTGNLVLNATGNIDATLHYINNVADPLQSSDAATKLYVDNRASAGLDIHPAVVNDIDVNVSAIYTDGGTTPTWTSITGVNTVETGSAHDLSVNDVIVFGSTTNGITAGTPYFVKSTPTTTSITLSLNYNGSEIDTLSAGSVSITSLANAGVGATLTSTTNGPLDIEGYTGLLNDRILVVGQTDQAQNGVYYISQVGVIDPGGSPWILTRASDGNTYIPNSAFGLDNGAYFLVTGGDDAGEAYVLNTVGTIVIGTTNITFAQFAIVIPYTAGTGLTLTPNLEFSISNTTVTSGLYGNGDRIATFTVNGQGQLTAAANVVSTANAANLTGTILATGILTSSLTTVGTLGTLHVTGNANVGNLGTTGNITAGFFIGNGSQLTGITATSGTANILANGTSNVNIPTVNGNITIGSAGIGNVVVITSTGMNVTGTANISGNITSANANLGNLALANYVNVTSNITAGNANLGNLVTANYGNFANTLTVTGNANVGNLGTVGNISAGFFIGNGSELTGITATSGTANILANGTSNVNIPTINGNITIGSAGIGNIVVITSTGMNVSGTANISGNITSANANLGNLALANYVNVTSNITAGNANLGNLITANYGNFANTLTVIGNANVGNLGTIGNITAGFFIGNGSELTGITATSGTANILANGTSNVNIPTVNGNITIGSAGVDNVVVITSTGMNVTGTANISGNANVGNLGTIGNISAGFFLGNGSQLTGITRISNGTSNVSIPSVNGNVNIVSAGNTTLVVTGTGANITGTANISGNANVGNLGSSGLIIATGNVSGGNLTTGGVLAVTGNANVGNLGSGGLIIATGNVSGGNLTTGGALAVTGNANVGNLGATAGVFTGNVTSGNAILGNLASANFFSGDGYLLSNLTIAAGSSIINGNSNITVVANANVNISSNGIANVVVISNTGIDVAGMANITGNVVLTGPNVSLGVVGNLHITGGSNEYVLSTDGTGNLNWVATPTTIITVNDFTGDGLSTVFTLSVAPSSINQTVVNYNGALQLRASYTILGTALTFTSAPAAGSLIEVTITNSSGIGTSSGVTPAKAFGYTLVFGG